MQVFGLRLPRPRLSFEWLGAFSFLGNRLTWLYVGYTTLLFLVFLILTFPTDLLIKRVISLANPGPGFEFTSTRFAWLKGFEINGVRLAPGADGRQPLMELKSLWLRPVFSALIRGNPYAVHVQGDLYGGEAEGEVTYTNGKLNGTLRLSSVDISRYKPLTALLEEGQLTGKISGQFEFEGRAMNLDGAQGSGDLLVDGASINGVKVDGTLVPDVALKQSKVKFTLRGGKLDVQELKTVGDVNADASGQIVLRNPVQDSVLNARATVQPTGTTPDAIKALIAMIPRAPGSKPDAPMTITGTLTRPRVR